MKILNDKTAKKILLMFYKDIIRSVASVYDASPQLRKDFKKCMEVTLKRLNESCIKF